MTVNRTTLLDLPLPVTGTESGTWGDTTNNGLTQYMDIAIAGMSNLTSANFTAGALTIETTEGDSSATNISVTSAQYAGFRVSSLAVNSTITVGNTGTSPARSYRLINADSTYNLTFKATGQTGVTLLPGQSAVVAFNGTDYVIVGTVGAGTATDNAVARFDGTTGEILQNSAATIDDTGAATFVGSVNVSGTSASAADLKLYEDTDNGTNYVAFKSPASVASNVTWTLPSADGTNGQALTTNGSGTLAFSSVTTSPGGSNTQIQYNNSGAFGGSSNLTWDGTNFRTAGNARIEGTGIGLTGTGAGAEIYANSGNVYYQAYNRTTSAYAPVSIGGSEVIFTTAGFERMRIDSSGNVGIGTTTPGTYLEVASPSGSGSGQINIHSPGGGGIITKLISERYGPFRISAEGGSGSGITFETGNSVTPVERMRITSGGVVMVGATSAHGSEKVLINGGGTSPTGDGYLTLRRGSDASSGSGVGVIDFADTRTSSIYAKIQAIADAAPGTNDFPGALVFYTTADGASSTTERMRIDSAGNVGIGTSSPNDVLTVGGLNAFIRVDRIGNEPGIEFRVSSSTTNRGRIAVTTSGDMYFTSGGATERMRILSGGNVCINSTTDVLGQGARLHITGNSAQTACSIKIGSDGVPGWYFANSAGAKVGDIVINTSSTAYNTSSDYRLKENIAPMTGALETVAQLNPVTYTWKIDGSAGQGFIAHELQEVAPYAVTGEKDGEQMQGVDYGKLTPILTAALQEAIAKIETLEARLAVLEAK